MSQHVSQRIIHLVFSYRNVHPSKSSTIGQKPIRKDLAVHVSLSSFLHNVKKPTSQKPVHDFKISELIFNLKS